MNEHRHKSLSAGLFLIGLGLLFLLRVGIWPWILAVIGVAGLPAALASNRGWLGFQSAFWLIGLALLFASGYFWPGILILVGLSVLLGGLAHGASRTVDEGTPHQGAAEPFDVDAPLFDEDASEPSASHDTRQL
jgi:hypothetical protein